MTDNQIVELYIIRDERAITESTSRYGAYCNKIAMNILHSREDSEECVADTWHNAWNSIPPQKPLSLSAFFGKIVRNLAITRYRKSKAGKRSSGGLALLLSEFGECIPSREDTAGQVESRLLVQIIDDWLSRLNKEDRAVFIRRYWFGDSVKELAKECGVTPAKMAQTMLKLRKSLKAKLEMEGVEI